MSGLNLAPLQGPPVTLWYWKNECRKHECLRCIACYTPVQRGPRLLRSPRGRIWHRPRWGITWRGELQFKPWCAMACIDTFSKGRFATGADCLPVGDDLCAYCEAHATRAGQCATPQEPGLLVLVRTAS